MDEDYVQYNVYYPSKFYERNILKYLENKDTKYLDIIKKNIKHEYDLEYLIHTIKSLLIMSVINMDDVEEMNLFYRNQLKKLSNIQFPIAILPFGSSDQLINNEYNFGRRRSKKKKM